MAVAFFPNSTPFYGKIVKESKNHYTLVGHVQGHIKVYTFPKDFVEKLQSSQTPS